MQNIAHNSCDIKLSANVINGGIKMHNMIIVIKWNNSCIKVIELDGEFIGILLRN